MFDAEKTPAGLESLHDAMNRKPERELDKAVEDAGIFDQNPAARFMFNKNTQFVDTTGTGQMAMTGKSCVTRKAFDRATISLFIAALRAIMITKGGHKCNKIAASTLKEYETRCKNTIFMPEADNHPKVPRKYHIPTVGPELTPSGDGQQDVEPNNFLFPAESSPFASDTLTPIQNDVLKDTDTISIGG